MGKKNFFLPILMSDNNFETEKKNVRHFQWNVMNNAIVLLGGQKDSQMEQTRILTKVKSSRVNNKWI